MGQMVSKADKYQQMIQDRTKKIILFPHTDNQCKKSTVTLKFDIKLPSSHTFRSSQQIENNKPITHQITHQSSKWCPTVLHNKWPYSCIGLILCEHHQNNQTFYVYGTGTLIHNNIVLTSAQNLYCRRLKRQYTNIKFIVGVNGDKCSGIYDVMKVYYPKEYMQELFKNYNFSVLQLYDDLSDNCGYIGWKTIGDIKEVQKYTEYEYISNNQEGSFYLREITKNKKSQDQCCSRNGVLVKQNENKYSIVGIHNSIEREGIIILNEKIKTRVNQWTHFTIIYLSNNDIGAQGCKQLIKSHWTHLKQINLHGNNIGAQGCKYLSQVNWIHLIQINLHNNNIGGQGCKYLNKADWTHLKYINLQQNQINAQGCKYLSQADWTHLTRIHLDINNIGAQGCKYLSQANWAHLALIELRWNKIDEQGCKYLIQTNWTHLTYIDLYNNEIEGIIYRLLFLSSNPNTQIEI